nr:MAG TPA: hypothetical protein [Bacteriophage sp.]
MNLSPLYVVHIPHYIYYLYHSIYSFLVIPYITNNSIIKAIFRHTTTKAYRTGGKNED